MKEPKHNKDKNGKEYSEKVLFANVNKLMVIQIIQKRKYKILAVVNNYASFFF